MSAIFASTVSFTSSNNLLFLFLFAFASLGLPFVALIRLLHAFFTPNVAWLGCYLT